MKITRTHVRVGLGVAALSLLVGCGCYPNIKSVEPQPKKDTTEANEEQANAQLVTDGNGNLIVLTRREG